MNGSEKPVGSARKPDEQEVDTDISDAAAVASGSVVESKSGEGAPVASKPPFEVSLRRTLRFDGYVTAEAMAERLAAARAGVDTDQRQPLGSASGDRRSPGIDEPAQAKSAATKSSVIAQRDAFAPLGANQGTPSSVSGGGLGDATQGTRCDVNLGRQNGANQGTPSSVSGGGLGDATQSTPDDWEQRRLIDVNADTTASAIRRSTQRQGVSPDTDQGRLVEPKAGADSKDPGISGSIPPQARATHPSIALMALTEPQAPPAGRGLWKKLLAAVVILIVLGVIGTVGAVVFTVKRFEVGLPSAKELRHPYRPPQVTRIWSRQEKNERRLLSEVFTERRTVVPFSAVPNVTKYAFLAAEDAYFYEHQGLSYLGMLRAMWANVRAGRVVQGGSTITQQVVKNLYLESKRHYARKIQETILARRLEQSLSKDEIFELYLNLVYLGHGRYGIEEAARCYFAKSVSELDLAESSILAGIVHSPERYSPYSNNRQRTLERQAVILQRMVDKQFITEAQKKEAQAQELRFAPKSDSDKASDVSPEMVTIAKQILAKAAPEQAALGGFDVSTTIDPELQKYARSAVSSNLRAYATKYGLAPPYSEKSGKMWGPLATVAPRRHSAGVGKVVAVDDAAHTLDVRVGDLVGQVRLDHEKWLFDKEQLASATATVGARVRVVLEGDPQDPKPLMRLDPVPQSALVAIDVRTREVLALVGGREGTPGGLDRATQAHRQPGSSFKPFVYSQALSSKKYNASTILVLAPTPKRPEPMKLSVRDALARSENDAAILLLESSGPAKVVEFAKECGIESKLAPTPSLALGAYEVSLLELTNAYATFASGGISAPPVFVTRIARTNGKTVRLPVSAEPKRVMTAEEAYLITSLMRGVVERGTAQRAKSVGRPVVGKTGTTNRAKDTWFVGYSPDIVVGVWVGFDDPISLGYSETGANTALPAWVEFMKAALAPRPRVDFPRPSGIVVERIDPETGGFALPDQPNAVDEEFLPGTGPLPLDAADAGVVPPPAASAEGIAASPSSAVDTSESPGQAAQAGAGASL